MAGTDEGMIPAEAAMDFPTAWRIARATPPEYHHNQCSFNVTNGGMLCDCDVLKNGVEK